MLTSTKVVYTASWKSCACMAAHLMGPSSCSIAEDAEHVCKVDFWGLPGSLCSPAVVQLLATSSMQPCKAKAACQGRPCTIEPPALQQDTFLCAAIDSRSFSITTQTHPVPPRSKACTDITVACSRLEAA